jgi:hypothetical protein
MSSNKTETYLMTLPDWQRANLELLRRLIHDSESSVTEDFKWNVPVFVFRNKTYFAMSGFKAHTKFNFMINGALLDDPKKLFNNGLDSKKSRGIDMFEGQTINEADLKALIRDSLNN